jgi:hypothetical protein
MLIMEISEIWVSIIIPLLIGPIFIYLKSLYDNYAQNSREHNLLVYNTKTEYLTQILNNFYWPLYLKLLCIHQLNYNIPIKNKYEYISDDESNDYDLENECIEENNDNITINIINKNKNTSIILDTETIHLMEQNINKLFKETINIIENNIYNVRLSKNLNKHIVEFIKFCKIRQIINEGSIGKKYNIEYFGTKDNTSKLLKLIEFEINIYKEQYNTLLETGPFN